MNKGVVSILTAVLLSSCAAKLPTKASSGAKTSFEFENTDPASTVVLITLQDDYDCYGRKIHKFFAQWDKFELEEEQRPYQTFNYVFSGVGYSGGKLASVNCGGLVTFRADESNLYRVTISHTDGMCGAKVMRSSSSSPAGWVVVPIVNRTQKTPFWDDNGPYCEANEAFKGSSLLAAPRGF